MTASPDDVRASSPFGFDPSRNCWRVARAETATMIVNGADYFEELRRVMLAARRELLLVGWDFDLEIEMLPGRSDDDGLAPDGYPNMLGPFLEAVVERSSDLRIYLLKWNGALLVAPGRILPTAALRFFGGDRIHIALDGHHPFGACHHQKIVVADDVFAFCGGIDMTEDRWDTADHTPGDPRRVRKNGSPAPPWHDVTTALTGPVVQALGELSRRRWLRATGETLERPDGAETIAPPDDPRTFARNIDVAIARTEPPFDEEPLVNEIEQLYLDQVAAARKWIFVESQYFAAGSVCDALEARLKEPDGPEIVVVNPQAALSTFEDEAMHVMRGRVISRMEAADPGGRFRIYHPANAAGEPIYVHAKVFLTDNRILRIGSSNLDDRSMGFDTECDVALEADGANGDLVALFRARLLGEHMGVASEAVARELDRTGSLVRTIEALNPAEGRGLRRIAPKPEGVIGGWLADHRIMDPRYRHGERSDAGEGLRPRHVAMAAAGLGIGIGAWMAWERWGRR